MCPVGMGGREKPGRDAHGVYDIDPRADRCTDNACPPAFVMTGLVPVTHADQPLDYFCLGNSVKRANSADPRLPALIF